MVTKENKIDKICSFYASDFHLEMIMLPYINRKIEEEAKIIILTQKKLESTVKIVISKINLSEERKKEILNIDWNNSDCKKVMNSLNKEKELIIFIIGDKNYIEKTNSSIDASIKNIDTKIIDCYELAEIQEDITEIVSKHKKVLNTIEEKEFKQNY